MQYNFNEIEKKWQAYWTENNSYKVENNFSKPKCYVLDMFPYPSGAGLHVGHPLGYIASDIYARYKRLKGFNVLHPMGFDAFGLPAEQYAIETGQHPATTTKVNIERYKEQLGKIGFCYDWSREVKTSDPSYYKWTQWIFLQLYNSWYNPKTDKAELISSMSEVNQLTKEDLMNNYRLAYKKESYVNWCEALGTVLANDEVVNGVSERGGHPVERKLMSQWFLRITSFAERLLNSLDNLDFPESLKEMQRNWIGKSVGAEISWQLADGSWQSKNNNENTDNRQPTTDITVFTTRPDTIFGVSFMVLAPEHELVNTITTAEQKQAIEEYQKFTSSRSERERLAETKSISGCFTGAYVIHPFTGKQIPIWISEYVLAGYGTGAIMAVPCGDERDFAFAKHFNIEIPNIFKDVDISEKACSDKNVVISNSDFISDLSVKEASKKAINKIEELKIGTRKINYRMRDAGFSRQRYWGEPFPIVYDENGTAIALTDKDLPLELPFLETYSAGPNGKGPLANATNWVNSSQGIRETDTMPGYSGSSWYYLRYMDPHNTETFCDKNISDYWNQVDVYVGGAEHAVGHLLYSRMWCKTLHDLGYISYDEPYKKLINQGMIQGSSRFVYRYKNIKNLFVSYTELERFHLRWFKENKLNAYFQELESEKDPIKIHKINSHINYSMTMEDYKDKYDKIHVDVSMVDGNVLDIEKFKLWKNKEYNNSEFVYTIPVDDKNTFPYFLCSPETEKMSKSKYNVVNPDDIIEQYGADTFRMYEMFLGPLEMSKPWDTKGIEGVHRFLKKFWRLYCDETTGCIVTNDTATKEELKTLHKHIKKIQHDIENFAFNTSVSQFMIITNELSTLNCHKREILESVLITLVPFAPHIAEELWSVIGNTTSILDAQFPVLDESLLVENAFNYPVAILGKPRTEMEFALDATQEDIQTAVLANEIVQKWMEGKPVKKFIFVKGKMINVVV